MNKFLKLFILLIIFSCLALSSTVLAQTPAPTEATPILISAPVAYPAYSAGEFKVTIADLTKAGFTGVKAGKASGDLFASPTGNFPNNYFQVNEKISGAQGTAWGSTANLVAVFMRKMPTDWTYNNGEMKIIDLEGRSQASILTKSNNLIIVTGPEEILVSKLAANLAALY
ncbi:MAG: hypothetical protein WC460_03470 [Patescibacteria group bacterium]